MPCAIGAFLQEASEFRHHSHQTSLDVCEMDGLRCLQLKKELFYGKLSSFSGLYSHRRWIEAGNFGFRKWRNCTIHVAKTKALISFAVTAKLICAFVFSPMQIVGFPIEVK